MGTTTQDFVGNGGVTVLGTGNYVLNSPNWDNAGMTDVGAATWESGTAGTSGNISTANSLVGPAASSGLSTITDNPANGTFIALFPATNRMEIGVPDISKLTYAMGAGADIGVTPSRLTAVLSTGTNLVLEANNDITIDSPITVPGTTGGGLTLRAGRSIIVNANISTANGALTLIANDALANGVVDADREPGPASLTMANGVLINTGSGPVDLELQNGAGKTYADVGHMELYNVATSGNLTLLSNGPIVEDGGLTIGGTTTLTATSDVNLATPFNSFGSPVLIPFAATDVALASTGTFQLGAATVDGNLTVQAGGQIIQAGALTAYGTASFTTSGGSAITLDNAANDFRAAVDLNTNGAATVVDANTLVLGDATVGNALTVTTNGALTDAGTISVLGATNLAAGGNAITLDSAGNNFVGPVTVTGTSPVTLVDINSLPLGPATFSSLTVTAGGQVSETGAITVTGTTTLAAGSVALDTSTNSFGGTVGLTTTGNAALKQSGALNLAASTVGGNLTVTAGSIGQSAPLTVSGATTLTGAVSLANGGNDFAGTVSLSGSSATINDKNSLTLGSSAVTGALSATAGTSVTVSAPLVAQGSVNLTAGTDITLGNLTTGAHPVTLQTGGNAASLGTTTTVSTGGSLFASNGLTVGNGETLTGGGSVTVGSGAKGLSVQTGGTLDPAGTLTVNGDVSLAADSVLAETVNGTAPGQFDVLAVNGAVALGGSTLELTVGYTPALSDAATILTNDGADPIVGTFAQGYVVTAGGAKWQVNYTAPDGNDLKLTAAEVGLNNNPPSLSSVPVSAIVNEQTTLAFTATASDIDFGQTLTFGLSGAPAGATISPSTGAFAWTPSEAQGPDTYTFDVTVTDGTAVTSQSITVEVNEVNTAPTLSNVPANPTVARGTPLAFTATATDPDLVHGLGNALTFSLVGAPAGAVIDPSTGVFTWTPTSSTTLGVYTFQVRVTDDGVPSLSDSKTVIATVTGNTPPSLSGVPTLATVNEQTQLTFTAVGTDPDPQTLTYSLVGAPSGATIDPSTGVFTWTPSEAQGPNTFAFAVAVSDGLATVSQPITVIVNEVNTAPTLSNVPAAATTAPGSTVAFTATATDSDLINGLGNALTFSLVGGPSGAVIDPDTGAFSWTPGDFNLPGNYTFKVRVTDDGVPAMSDSKSITIAVKPAAVVNGDLLVGGTAGSDAIAVAPSKDLSQIIVTLNKAVAGTFPAASVTGKIVVHGLSGNDTIGVSTKLTKPAWLFGEAGNDKLTGGGGNNLLVGGDGNDTLAAKAGTNVMIGGNGADKLTGGSGDDLLIAGPTAYDADAAGLANIFNEWTSGLAYNQRIADLTAGVSGTMLTAATVSDDGVKDTLAGKKGADWFIVSATDKVSDLDAKLSEVKTVI
jgi:hypothetical protein